jgi:hypothetical protein
MKLYEYRQFQRNFSDFFEQENLANLSIAETETDPHFSKSPCDCCKSPLHGNRYQANGAINDSDDIWEGNVCEDCIYYAEYGRLDDQQMEEIKKQKNLSFPDFDDLRHHVLPNIRQAWGIKHDENEIHLAVFLENGENPEQLPNDYIHHDKFGSRKVVFHLTTEDNDFTTEEEL